MRFFIIFTIFNLLSIFALTEKDYAVNSKTENEFYLIGLLETGLSLPDEFVLNEIIVIASQNVILETVDSSNKPDNFDDLVENWIDILSLLAVKGTGSVMIKEFKPYMSKNYQLIEVTILEF